MTPDAGYDTTAMTLAHAVYAIATHADVEARLLAEIDSFGCVSQTLFTLSTITHATVRALNLAQLDPDPDPDPDSDPDPDPDPDPSQARAMSCDDLDSFTWTTAVVKESLRMWPTMTPQVALQRCA